MEGCLNQEWGPILSCCGGTVGGCPEGQLPPRAPRPMIGRGQATGGPSANAVGARKTQG